MSDQAQLPADEVSPGPLLHTFSREQMLGRAQEFMRLHFGDVRSMPPDQQRAYHETMGILMFYIDHLTSSWCSPNV
jgi:hypothetical protein